MTTYTAIADADIDPESPGNTTLFTRLRDNPIAAFEKAAGAPVLANDYVTNAMIATGAVNADSIAANAVGTSEIAAGVVAAEYAGTASLAVGSIMWGDPNNTTANNATISGSNLQPAYWGGSTMAASGSTVSGTWRNISGVSLSSSSWSGLWLRIS